MISVLHVTPHLGGGVGRVLLNYLSSLVGSMDERHTISCLDYANDQATERAAATGIYLEDRMAWRTPDLLERMAKVDIVVLHWWNHPLLYALMVRETLPPTRLVLWSHVSGLFPTQNFTDALIAYPDIFVMASPVSLDSQAMSRITDVHRREKVRLVFTCAGIEHVAATVPLPHDGFRIGYVGTVDYCKMHPDFIRMSAAARIPEARFIVCGGPNEVGMREEARRVGTVDRFEFLGQVSDVGAHLAKFDVFGYPLAPYHYGTGEQALIEALAVGIPPVVFANGAEQHVVKDGITGIVARSEAEYTQALEYLYCQPELRLRLGKAARSYSRATFTIEKLARSWSDVYQEIMSVSKRTRHWETLTGQCTTAATLFLASLGEFGTDYAISMNTNTLPYVIAADERIAHASELFRARTRGSVFHYQAFFPDDPWLNFWCALIEFEEGNCTHAIRRFDVARDAIGHERIDLHLEMNHVNV